MTPTQGNAIDQIVVAEMERGSIPGLALAVAQSGRPILMKGYGFADLEHKVPVTEHTIFKLASVTKTFTATAVMMLVEQGEAELDDSISKHLPDLPQTWRAITLRHLLGHTTGLKNYEPAVSSWLQPKDPLIKIVRAVSELPLNAHPGEAYAYTNTNYVVLSLFIETLSGNSYQDFLRGYILQPLYMSETRVNDPDASIPNRAQGYAWDGETLSTPGQPPLRKKVNPTPQLWGFGDGGMLSTALDMTRWDAALYAETLLRASSLHKMWVPGKLSNGTAFGYGLGWITSEFEGHRNIGHWGRNPGFMAQLSRFVDDALTVVVLCNRWKADVGGLTNKVANVYVPGIAPRSLDTSG